MTSILIHQHSTALPAASYCVPPPLTAPIMPAVRRIMRGPADEEPAAFVAEAAAAAASDSLATAAIPAAPALAAPDPETGPSVCGPRLWLSCGRSA